MPIPQTFPAPDLRVRAASADGRDVATVRNGEDPDRHPGEPPVLLPCVVSTLTLVAMPCSLAPVASSVAGASRVGNGYVSGDLVGLNETVGRAGAYAAAVAAAHERDAEAARTAERARVAAATRTRTAPTVSPTPRSTSSSCGYADAIVAAGLPSSMVSIAWRESRCTPGVASSTGCLGLFQICWPLHADVERAACGRSDRAGLFDPSCNIAVARRLYGGSGGAPWSL